eukprot:6174378-Pleurochrysis_carterae.AAC.4
MQACTAPCELHASPVVGNAHFPSSCKKNMTSSPYCWGAYDLSVVLLGPSLRGVEGRGRWGHHCPHPRYHCQAQLWLLCQMKRLISKFSINGKNEVPYTKPIVCSSATCRYRAVIYSRNRPRARSARRALHLKAAVPGSFAPCRHRPGVAVASTAAKENSGNGTE